MNGFKMTQNSFRKIDEAEELVFKKKLQKMKEFKGRGTELISLYLPENADRSSVMGQITTEMGQSANIKSPTTRKNVQGALRKIAGFLKAIDFKIPKRGLVVFAGNISQTEGKSDIRLFTMRPLRDLKTKLYWCDSAFHLVPLEEMIKPTEAYALLVIDKREATLAILYGKKHEIVGHFTSAVAGKTRAGGQCLDPKSLVLLSDGQIQPIKKLHNPNQVKAAKLTRFALTDSKVTQKWETKKKPITITTKYPRIRIVSSSEHVFFTFNEEKDQIEEKPASKLKPNDIFLMPEKISTKSNLQKLGTGLFNNYHLTPEGIQYLISKRKKQGLSQTSLGKRIGLHQATVSTVERNRFRPRIEFLTHYCEGLGISLTSFLKRYAVPVKAIWLPPMLQPELAQIVGYFLGNGHFEKQRIGFSEQRKQVAQYYANLCQELFQTTVHLRYRKNKGYYQLRVNGKPLVRYLKQNFFPQKNTLYTGIPQNILQSPNNVLAAFLRGLFDAEGYISKGGLGLGINNQSLAIQVQLALLRFGILASLHEYDAKRNPYPKKRCFTVRTAEKESLKRFSTILGFTATDKQAKLKECIQQREGRRSVRQLLAGERQIRKLFEQEYLNTQNFPSVTNFFRNQRYMSKEVFKKQILSKVRKHPKLEKKFLTILNRQLLPVQIARIQQSNQKIPMIDISVQNQNFFANGLLVHNSAARFEHLREEAAKDFFRRVSEKINRLLVEYEEKLKGLIIGGPGITKQEFLKHGVLDYRLKNKILGTVDISYTDESGIRELMQKSEEILKDTAITRERQIVNRFLEEAVSDGLAAYGQKEVENALESGQASDALVSEAINWLVLKEKCAKCEQVEEKIVTEPLKFDASKERCAKCGAKVEMLEEVDYLDWLIEKAHSTSTKVHVISQETPEGQTFYRGFGGIGALLRYK